MANEEIEKEEKVVETPEVDVEEQETDTLLGLIKQGAELSRISAMVNLAYIRAKTVDKTKEGYAKVSSIIDDKVKATVGTIKENSRLYDETKAKKEEIEDRFTRLIDAVADRYDKRIEDLLAEKARLENENLGLAADNQDLKLEQKDAKSQYRSGEKVQKGINVNREIAAKKAEAEKLAKEGDLEGAQAAIAEYKRLKEAQVQETSDGMLGIAEISQKIKLNRQQFKANKERIKEIEAEIKELEMEKEESIDKLCDVEEKKLTEVDDKTSMFKKLAMLASKAMTKIFNKGKAINNQVFEPMKKKIEEKLPQIKTAIETKFGEIKEDTKKSFKEKLESAMEFGRGVRQGAIDRLKARNDKKREKQKSRQEYLDKRKADENEK